MNERYIDSSRKFTEDANLENDFQVEVSEKEKRYFAKLDKFGEVGSQLLSEIYNNCLPKTFLTDNISNNLDISLDLSISEALTKKQKEFLASVFDQLKYDHTELLKILGDFNKDALLKRLHSDLLPYNIGQQFDPERVSITVVPGGICLLVHDRKYFNEKFPDSKGKLLGFFQQGKNYQNYASFPGRIFVVDTTSERTEITFRHEYLHLLTNNYIEPYEILPELPIEAGVLLKAIEQLQSEIVDLNDEMDLVDYDDILVIQQEIGRKNKKISELQRKKTAIINKSEVYLTEEAQRFYKDMRDELTAYAIGSEFNTVEDMLIPGNISWNDRISQIENESDRYKLQTKWKDLKIIINLCKQKKISAQDLLPIFITSSNFDQMAKRLSLFIEKHIVL